MLTNQAAPLLVLGLHQHAVDQSVDRHHPRYLQGTSKGRRIPGSRALDGERKLRGLFWG